MKREVKIGSKIINENSPVFIIAEAGVNHNGDIELAKRLILEAKLCGADCVKFQSFKAERVVTKNSPKAKYQLKTTDPSESQIEMLKKLELSENVYGDLIELCNNKKINFLSTPYNIEDVEFLNSIGVTCFKLPSICIGEPAFLKYVAKKMKPVILSTGMATLAEIDDAVRIMHEAGNEELILLQCTTNYPSRLEDANLLAMKTMRAAFGTLVGYSDHTQDETACIVSVALGARVIEKHFTLDKNLPGPDQSSSANPEEFAKLVRRIRDAELVLGSQRKQPCKIEKVNAEGMRRSIVAKKGIPKGTEITEEMITFKRPALGISPKLYDLIIGKKALEDILPDELIQMDKIEW